MSTTDPTGTSAPDQLRSIDSSTHTVAPQKFADAVYRDGRLRYIADPRGEWLESDVVMEVRE